MTAEHPLRHAFREQGKACASLGSPFMDRLCQMLATELQPGKPLTDRLFNWTGELGPRAASVPLRLCGALHALRLNDRAELATLYPPNHPSDEAFANGIMAALETEADFVNAFIDSAPQTNEVRRSAALIAMAHWVRDEHALPFRITELGASAGLNLNFDRYALQIAETRRGPIRPVLTLTPDWRGKLPPPTAPQIIERRAVDLNPLDPKSDNLRLRAYLWPDQPERMALTDAAIAAADTPVERADAIDWLSTRLGHEAGTLHFIYTTIAWQYFPSEAQDRGTALIEAAGAAATSDTPLAWATMENDGGAKGAKLTLRLWPGDQTIDMGRADFHGRWIDWQAP